MPDPGLPRVAADARFVAPERARGRPHAVVDGPRLPGTVLALSHWRGSGTPKTLRADTSAAAVELYLDAAPNGPELDLVTNNHFDEDGLFGIWLLLERPAPGAPERRLAVAAAAAGDFGVWDDPAAAHCALAAMALAAPASSPLLAVRTAFSPASAADPTGPLYAAILPAVGPLLADPERHRALWEPGWRQVAADIALLDAGEATITEVAGADTAIVRTPRPLGGMAMHPRTGCMRILTALPGGVLVLRHRYETWVDYVSRPLAPRVDLARLLPRLQAAERNSGTWRFEGVEPIQPRLFLAGPGGRTAPSSLGADRLTAELEAFLGEPAEPAATVSAAVPPGRASDHDGEG